MFTKNDDNQLKKSDKQLPKSYVHQRQIKNDVHIFGLIPSMKIRHTM